jgi:hypothetical protein
MRFKLSTLVGAAVMAVALPSMSSAQAFQGDLGGPPQVCALDIFVSFTATKCAGFYSGNAVTGSITAQALNAFGPTKLNVSPSSVIEKIDTWNGTDSFVNTTMYGTTVIGMHWGNYAAEGVGNVSAFFVFDAGTTGIKDVDLKAGYLQGISNVAIYSTGTSTVPEPSTYALMAAGLAGLGIVARRRRNTAV